MILVNWKYSSQTFRYHKTLKMCKSYNPIVCHFLGCVSWKYVKKFVLTSHSHAGPGYFSQGNLAYRVQHLYLLSIGHLNSGKAIRTWLIRKWGGGGGGGETNNMITKIFDIHGLEDEVVSCWLLGDINLLERPWVLLIVFYCTFQHNSEAWHIV